MSFLRKKDIFGALIIGEAVAWLLVVMLRVNAPELPIPSTVAQTLASSSTAYVLAVVFPILSVLGLALASLLSRAISILYQVAKFVLVGALNTFVDLGILNGFILVTGVASGTGYLLFKTVAFAAALTNSYLWNKHWTFESTGAKTKDEAIQFGLVSVVGFFLNIATAHIVVNVIGPQAGLAAGIWGNVGALAAIVVALFWNFFGYKLWVFKKR